VGPSALRILAEGPVGVGVTGRGASVTDLDPVLLVLHRIELGLAAAAGVGKAASVGVNMFEQGPGVEVAECFATIDHTGLHGGSHVDSLRPGIGLVRDALGRQREHVEPVVTGHQVSLGRGAAGAQVRRSRRTTSADPRGEADAPSFPAGPDLDSRSRYSRDADPVVAGRECGLQHLLGLRGLPYGRQCPRWTVAGG
jgi:hypothetical protein